MIEKSGVGIILRSGLQIAFVSSQDKLELRKAYENSVADAVNFAVQTVDEAKGNPVIYIAVEEIIYIGIGDYVAPSGLVKPSTKLM